jgi:hypothetical protein
MKKIAIITGWLLFGMATKAQDIVQAEYFIDTDAGIGNSLITLTDPQPDGNFNLNINLSGVSSGYHKLFIRTKDSDGKWSLFTRRNIQVVSNNVVKNIVSGEYFFDSDPGFNAGTPIIVAAQDSIILQNFTTATGALSIGYHKLYIRMKDSEGNWGHTSRRNVEVIRPFMSLISGAEYFFISDAGIGNASPVTFSSPAIDGSFSFKIPLSNIPIGSHTLFIRAKDSVSNNYSITQWQGDSVITSVQAGLWSDINTWSNKKIPGANTVVLIYHNVIVDIDGFCKSLTPYGNSVSAIVNSGKTLNVTGH